MMIIVIILLCAIVCAGADEYPSVIVCGANKRHTMFLPLFDNSRHHNNSKTRRYLEGTNQRSNAHMRLHDDLLRNGYYTTRLYIGTPPQKFALIVDTGSSVTYVPCSSCKQCGPHEDPKFQPNASSSYKPVKCNSDCTCDSNRESCIYERNYAEMSSSSGVLGDDIISFGNESELAPQRVIFGYENAETGNLYSQHADGIMGLGRGELSIVDQLVDRKIISDSFSLCYGGMEIGGGGMVLGAISPPSDMVFTRSDPSRSPYYNIELKELNVGGTKLSLNPGVFDGKHGTVLDSGTTYAYLPEAAFIAFKDAGLVESLYMHSPKEVTEFGFSNDYYMLKILKEVHLLQQIPGPDPTVDDICFAGAGSHVLQLSKNFPIVEMVFGNKQKLSLSPENYLFRHVKVHGAYCLGIFQNGQDPTTLLGGIVVRNTLVTYDREHEQVGFWKTNCSELWEKIGITNDTQPIPLVDERKNSTADVSSTLALPAAQKYNLSGEIQVGLITFYVSLNVSYVDLQPHISDLAQSIAHELGVNTSQVHWFIRWILMRKGRDHC